MVAVSRLVGYYRHRLTNNIDNVSALCSPNRRGGAAGVAFNKRDNGKKTTRFTHVARFKCRLRISFVHLPAFKSATEAEY